MEEEQMLDALGDKSCCLFFLGVGFPLFLGKSTFILSATCLTNLDGIVSTLILEFTHFLVVDEDFKFFEAMVLGFKGFFRLLCNQLDVELRGRVKPTH